MLGKWANFKQFDDSDLREIEDFLKKDEKDWAGMMFFYLTVL